MADSVKRPAIRVWCSNELECLAARLIENLGTSAENPASSLFAMAPIIVPNRSIETYLKYEIARGAGIAAGLKFHVIETFLAELLPLKDKDGRELRLLNHATLQAFFLEALSEQSPAEPLPKAVENYLAAAGDDEDARDLRRFQLASRLARLARQYGDKRPDLLRAWADGRATLVDSPLSGTEEWQRDIWARLIRPDRLLAPTLTEKERFVHWILPQEFFGFLDEFGFASPPEVHLFGFSYIWQGLREMIDRLRRDTTVDIYTLSPSQSLGHKQSAQGAEPTLTLAPHEAAGLSLVAHWGRPGREYFQMLGELPDVELCADFVENDRKTVLGRLQREILRDGFDDDSTFHPDRSLMIHGCPGIRREAEFVANEIWRLIHDDKGFGGSSSNRLRFCDVAVLIADAVNQPAYQAHFRAVFEDLHGIPFNMVDLPVAGECRVVEAMLLLLDLPLGEFTRPALLKILNHQAVRVRFPEADANQWRDWCLELEVVRGADQSDHEGTYIDRDLFNWEQGLRRLVLGAFMTGPRTGDERVFRLGDSEYLPHDQSADALASAARLLVLVRSLVADARFARSTQLTMTDWSKFFVGMVHAYLGVPTDNDSEQRALSGCLQKIQSLQGLDVSGRKLGYRIACESLRKSLEGWTETRGHYLADGVVVSPLLEMRSLPFRVVFLCGLGEGRFPATGGPDPLDLTLANRNAGDVSPRERDKYLFLETLMCAHDQLYLSYVDRDAQTGDPLEPSPVVNELMRHLARGRAGSPSEIWVNKQPLRRFDQDYFPDEAERERPKRSFPNFSTAARSEWRARKLRESLRNHCKEMPRLSWDALRQLDPTVLDFLGLCPLESSVDRIIQLQRLAISFRDLRHFLECPLQGWARLMLRLREDEEEDEAAREDEPFETGRPRETALLREVFFDALGRNLQAVDPTTLKSLYEQRAELQARRGLIPIGLFGDVERRRHLACITDWHHAAQAGQLLEAGPFEIYRFGRAADFELVNQLQPPIVLDVPLGSSARPIRVELFGRTEITSRKLPGSLTPVLRTSATEKDFLRGFLDAVVLSLLHGHHDLAEYHADVIHLPDKNKNLMQRRTFRGIAPARAREFLITILGDLFGGPHAYLLPCEAVFDYLSEKTHTPIEASVERMKDNDRQACSSRYGPVPNFEQYDAPDKEKAHSIIERRFGLFRDAGGLSG